MARKPRRHWWPKAGGSSGSDEIRNANAELAGVTWQGQSQLAYQSLFDDTTTQVERTAELVRAVGQTLRAAKDGIIEADEAIGSRIIS